MEPNINSNNTDLNLKHHLNPRIFFILVLVVGFIGGMFFPIDKIISVKNQVSVTEKNIDSCKNDIGLPCDWSYVFGDTYNLNQSNNDVFIFGLMSAGPQGQIDASGILDNAIHISAMYGSDIKKQYSYPSIFPENEWSHSSFSIKNGKLEYNLEYNVEEFVSKLDNNGESTINLYSVIPKEPILTPDNKILDVGFLVTCSPKVASKVDNEMCRKLVSSIYFDYFIYDFHMSRVWWAMKM